MKEGIQGHSAAYIEFEAVLHPGFQKYLESLIPASFGDSVAHIAFFIGTPLTHT